MKKNSQKHNQTKRGITLGEALKIKNIRRALKESSEDQAKLLRKYGVM